MRSSRTQVWLILGLIANVAAWGLFSWRTRPAQAQAQVAPKSPIQFPITPDPLASVSSQPQPIAVQALDGTHFVVVTREPRLTTRFDQNGPWQNMLVTVVTHYTVTRDHLVPVEHVRLPPGYRALEP